MTYSVADIVQLHTYEGYFLDLVDDLEDGEFDCGCAQGAINDIFAELVTCTNDEQRAGAWARHTIWAIREYAEGMR